MMQANMHIVPGDELSYRVTDLKDGRRALAIINYDQGNEVVLFLDSRERAQDIGEQLMNLFPVKSNPEHVTRNRSFPGHECGYDCQHHTPDNEPHTVDS